MGVEPKIGGFPPKMDGEHNGKPYPKWMIWGYPSHVKVLLEEKHIMLLHQV